MALYGKFKGHPLPFMVMDAGVNDGGSSAIAAGAASSAVTTATSVATSATPAETLGVPSALGTPFVALAPLRPVLKPLEVVGTDWARSSQSNGLLPG